MSECTHNCSTCGESCSERTAPQSLRKTPHPESHIGKVFGVVSGKGGVGKSMVTSQLAVTMHRRGFKVGVMDADITGPSIPTAFGLDTRAVGDGESIFPELTPGGIKIISLNLLLENKGDPVVWRGSLLGGVVKQFWTDVLWGDIDYMFVDMPPGTGDVPLTVFQSLPVDGILVVTSPQELVSLIVEKALKMSELMHIPVLGLIENMSYFECPNCHEKVEIYGPSRVDESAQKYGISHTAKLPIDPAFAAHCDKGDIESYKADYLSDTAAFLEGVLGK